MNFLRSTMKFTGLFALTLLKVLIVQSSGILNDHLMNAGKEYMNDIQAISNFLGDLYDIEFEGYYEDKGATIYYTLLKLAISDISDSRHKCAEKPLLLPILDNLAQIFAKYVEFRAQVSPQGDIKHRNEMANKAYTSISACGTSVLGLKETDPSKVSLYTCGYTNVAGGGHAIQCEIIKRANGGADFIVYNTGDGIQYHPVKKSGPRELRQPLLMYEDVPLDEIQNEHFLRSLLEPKTFTSYGKAYTSDALYRATLGNRFSAYIKPEVQGIGYIQPQLAGTCVFSSMHAFVRTKLEANFPKDPFVFDRVYFLMGYHLLEIFSNNKNLQMDLIQTSNKNYTNMHYQAPQHVYYLMEKFASYLGWMIGKSEYKHNEYFPHIQGSKTSPHWRDAMLNIDLLATNNTQMSILNSMYGDSLQNLRNELANKIYEYEFSTQTTDFIEMNVPQPYKMKKLFNTISSSDLKEQLASIRMNRTNALPVHFNSSLSYKSKDTRLISKYNIISLLSDEQDMQSWFGAQTDQILAFQALFVRNLPIDPSQYDGVLMGNDSRIRELLDAFSRLFYDMLRMSGMIRVYAAPYYDIVLALYRLWFILFQLCAVLDPGIKEHIYFSGVIFENILNSKNFRNLPYSAHLKEEWEFFNSEVSKFRAYNENSRKYITGMNNVYNLLEFGNSYLENSDEDYITKDPKSIRFPYIFDRIKKVNADVFAVFSCSDSSKPSVELPNDDDLIHNAENSGILIHRDIKDPYKNNHPEFRRGFIQLVMLLKDWQSFSPNEWSLLRFKSIEQSMFPSKEFFILRSILHASLVLLQRNDRESRVILNKETTNFKPSLSVYHRIYDFGYSYEYSESSFRFSNNLIASSTIPIQWKTTIENPGNRDRKELFNVYFECTKLTLYIQSILWIYKLIYRYKISNFINMSTLYIQCILCIKVYFVYNTFMSI